GLAPIAVRAPAITRVGQAASVGFGGGPAESRAVAPVQRRGAVACEKPADLRAIGRRAGQRLCKHAGIAPARFGESQGQSPRRLSIDPERGAPAVYFHERGRGPTRRGDAVARGGSCLS